MAFTIWITGPPCSGKTTLSKELAKWVDCQRLDGDDVRKTVNQDLGFTIGDRTENIRRVAYVCQLLNDSGVNVVASFVSPTSKIRTMARRIIGADRFVLVYAKCSVVECERRDSKSMYAKARRGEIKMFTGVSAEYELPDADIIADTEHKMPAECANIITTYLRGHKLLRKRTVLFIGRYNPPHVGHKYLFDSVLDNDGQIVIAVRDTQISEINPLSAADRKKLLEKLYLGNPDVKVIIVPDIDEVCIGRNVGYTIMQVPDKIRVVSASNVRAGLLDDVPELIRDDVSRLMGG